MGEGESRDGAAEASAAERVGPTRREIVLAVVLFPLLLVLCGQLATTVEISERYRVDVRRITSNPPPESAVSDVIKESLAALPLEELDRSLFDPDLGFAARQVFEADPWVARVASVRRVFPRGLHVELDYREPFAVVDNGGVFLLADRQGRLLPVMVDRPAVPPPHLTVLGDDERGASARAPDPLWLADAVREGVMVLRDLLDNADAEVFEHLGVSAIDVSNVGGRRDPQASEVSLVLDRTWSDADAGILRRPVRVRWGRSSRHPLGRIELAVERKLENLRALTIHRPGLLGVREVDVRFEYPYVPTETGAIARD